MNLVYIERAVLDDQRYKERVDRLLKRLGSAQIVECERYGEVFNRRSQNFRLQKQRPALIVAKKHQQRVLKSPPDYSADKRNGYYFSTSLNCPYDCRYCFLQGMYQSAHQVVFVNYEDFLTEIDATLALVGESCWFNAGYDNDSLAYDGITKAIEFFVPAFAERPDATLELRSKSARINGLLALEPSDNVVCAFSLAPDSVAQWLEHRAPSPTKRLEAMAKLQQAGWPVAIRIEPVVLYQDYQSDYADLISTLADTLDTSKVHSVSFGSYRMPADFHRKIEKLYPDDAFFAGPFVRDENKLIGYSGEHRAEIEAFFTHHLHRCFAKDRVYLCG